MIEARKLVEKAHAARDEAGIKVRQPLNRLRVEIKKYSNIPPESVIKIIREELNIKNIDYVVGLKDEIKLDTKLTPELEQEGMLRDLVRQINYLRKKSGLTINDRVNIFWDSKDDKIKEVFAKYLDELKQQVLADKIDPGKTEGVISEQVKVGETEVIITLVK